MEILTTILPKNEKILEGGCGLAPYLIQLRELGYDVEGIDYSEGPIQRILAYDLLLPVKVGYVTAIPYPDKYFGGYLSLGVIEHLSEGPIQAIREAYRVLKGGGVFYVSVPRNNIFMRFMAPIRFLKHNRFIRKIFKKPIDTHYWEQFFNKDELRQLLQSEGFHVSEIHLLDHSRSLLALSDFFRNKNTYDEVKPVALCLGSLFEKLIPNLTACEMAFVCYKM